MHIHPSDGKIVKLVDQQTEKSHNLTVLSYDPDTITSSLNCKQVTPSVCDFKVNSRSPVITLHTYTKG